VTAEKSLSADKLTLRHVRRAAGSLAAHAISIMLEEKAIKPKTTHASLTPHTASSEESFPSSRFLFCGQFLKARIVADLIPDRIESQHRRSNRKVIRYLQQPPENGNRVIGIPK